MADRDRPLYAVLIDADNIPAKYAGAILKEITKLGEPALRKVYGDWSSSALNKWKNEVRHHGLVAYQETANTTGKNASDIGLVIDAMDILHGGRLDGFVLVSSDSDFTRLASRIREHGLDVFGMGERKAPGSFVNACQRFIYLDNLDDEEKSSEDSKDTKQNPTAAIPLILGAMDKIQSEDEWYTLGQLGQYITRDNPDFDARTYGKNKLSDLVEGLKRFETKKIGNQLHVRRID
ncbi:MAG: NYN domain-containing protein [Boseongicola sp.]|nr:NYN domain-containing protein [Boseongicola sp.]